MIQKTVLIILLLLVTALPVIAGTITGQVADSATNEGIQDATVFVKGTDKGQYTASNGSFSIKNVQGEVIIRVQRMGYEPIEQSVQVGKSETKELKLKMSRSSLEMPEFRVQANRAVRRETPIAFKTLDQHDISEKYTTQDMPELIDEVPGVFSSTSGLGDAEITMRGFEADKIQVLINGIPVNDPESQKVYWSNWTGLSSNVKSVQVQRGAGSSLYGSGAFGGSLNIETMGAAPDQEWTVRSSYGQYLTDIQVADGEGDIVDYFPYNYNLVLNWNSGLMYDRKLNLNVMAERKAGDYYIAGTNYDGWSFGLETRHYLGSHVLQFSFIGAPQEHNQQYAKSDRDLMDTLGRAYNRNNHEYQENYYFKPQLSLRHEWNISESQYMLTNFFYTKGDGGGKYLSQDKFDVETGEVHYHDGFFDYDNPQEYQNRQYGRNALYWYEEKGIVMDGFIPEDSLNWGMPSYNGLPVFGAGIDFFDSRYDYSWRNNSVSDHQQYGMNTYYEHSFNPMIKGVAGGELRLWNADHYRAREEFRQFKADASGQVQTLSGSQTEYDYSSTVLNASGYLRAEIKPYKGLNIMLDGQYAQYSTTIEENPIEIIDIEHNRGTGVYFYSTREMTDDDGNLLFDDSDYEKVFTFFSPKFGVNYNINEYFNVMANWSIAYKEPRAREWYSGYDGPDGNQMYHKNIVLQDSLGNYYNDTEEFFYGDLDPEQINTWELGIGYDGIYFDVNANYYLSNYKDKIESVDIPIEYQYWNADTGEIEDKMADAGLTLNAGQATHQGLELDGNFAYEDFDGRASLTIAQYRWTDMNVDEIFDLSAEEMEGKVVPYSPEQMFDAEIGYTIGELPLQGRFRTGLTFKWWDEYYCTYSNEVPDEYWYEDADGNVVPDMEVYNSENPDQYELMNSTMSSKLPAFMEVGVNFKYAFMLYEKPCFARLALNNVLNRKDNYSSGRVMRDYNRYIHNENGEFVEEKLNSQDYLYVTAAPEFNFFFTLEMKF